MDKKASGAKAVRGKQPRAMPNLLGLKGWYVSGTKRFKKHIQLTIEMTQPVFPHCCAQTGELCAADRPRKFGSRTIGIRDLPLHGEAIDLKAIRPRLQCRQCKKVVAAHTGLGRSQETDPNDRGLGPDIDPRHRMTTRLVRYIQAEAATQTFSEVGQEIALPEATVRTIFREDRGPSNDKMQIKAPRVLGIDDKYINKKLGTVFVDLEKKILLDVYKTNKINDLQPFLRCLDRPHVIEVVCQDMSGAYRSFCKNNLPWAHVVIDKFHVLLKANNAVDKARIRFQKTLESPVARRDLAGLRKAFLRRIPVTDRTQSRMDTWMVRAAGLRAAWTAKERFYGFYSQSSAEDANSFYESWLAELDQTTLENFGELISCMDIYRDEILNFFRVTALSDKRLVTNAYLEALNLQIQRMMHKAPRYDFETLRQKLLKAYGPDAKEKIQFARRGLKEGGRRKRRKGRTADTDFNLKKYPPLASKERSVIPQPDMFPDTIRQPLQPSKSSRRLIAGFKVTSRTKAPLSTGGTDRAENGSTSVIGLPEVLRADHTATDQGPVISALDQTESGSTNVIGLPEVLRADHTKTDQGPMISALDQSDTTERSEPQLDMGLAFTAESKAPAELMRKCRVRKPKSVSADQRKRQQTFGFGDAEQSGSPADAAMPVPDIAS